MTDPKQGCQIKGRGVGWPTPQPKPARPALTDADVWFLFSVAVIVVAGAAMLLVRLI